VNLQDAISVTITFTIYYVLEYKNLVFNWIINRPTDQPRTGYEGPEGEWMYSSIISSTSALDGVGG
jgi:hypothetical protein